jgi:hypothetical protein
MYWLLSIEDQPSSSLAYEQEEHLSRKILLLTGYPAWLFGDVYFGKPLTIA